MERRYIRFGEFTVDSRDLRVKKGRKEIRKGGKQLKPKAVAILVVLIRRRGAVVRGSELKEILEYYPDDSQRADSYRKYVSMLIRTMAGLDKFLRTITKPRDTEKREGGYCFEGDVLFTEDPGVFGDEPPRAHAVADSEVEASELWSQVEALRPLAAEALLSGALKANAHLRSSDFVEKLQSIRRRNVLEFFNPDNRLPTTIVYDRSYRSPTPGAKRSTTDDWLFEVRKKFDEQSLTYDTRGANYDEPTIHDLVKEPRNLISYASSKINPCTDDMIEELNKSLGLDIRFIYESDAGQKLPRSIFTVARQRERAALVFRGNVLKYQERESSGHDHGILLRYRFPEKERRQWIVFAGCSRPGSVAAGKVVFDRDFGEALWSRPDLRQPLRSFICLFETSFIPPHTDKPDGVRILELFQFP